MAVGAPDLTWLSALGPAASLACLLILHSPQAALSSPLRIVLIFLLKGNLRSTKLTYSIQLNCYMHTTV